MRRALALLLTLPLAACAGGQKPPASPPTASPGPPPSTPAAPAPGPAAQFPSRPVETRIFASISGTVTYRLRVALTPEAQVQVELRDVSRPDAEPALIAKHVIEKPGQVPIPFALEYDPDSIEAGHAYAVSARITDRGQLQFVTETRVPVLSDAAATPIEIVVVPVR